jgi:hypothetical protein
MSNEDKKPTLVGTETFEALTNAQLAAESAKIDAEMKMLDLELKREQVIKLRAQTQYKRAPSFGVGFECSAQPSRKEHPL